jgi:hypothetical protein
MNKVVDIPLESWGSYLSESENEDAILTVTQSGDWKLVSVVSIEVYSTTYLRHYFEPIYKTVSK